MSMKLSMVVYDPPGENLPYLAVVFAGDGTVAAVPFSSFDEAQAHVDRMGVNATILAEKMQRENK